MRLADTVPLCFEAREGEFDQEEVERFFAARRDVLMDAKAEPLLPLGKLSETIQRRWGEYLAAKAEAERPMNGTRLGSGKLFERVEAAGLVVKALPAITLVDKPSDARTAAAARQKAYRDRKKGGPL